MYKKQRYTKTVISYPLTSVTKEIAYKYCNDTERHKWIDKNKPTHKIKLGTLVRYRIDKNSEDSKLYGVTDGLFFVVSQGYKLIYDRDDKCLLYTTYVLSKDNSITYNLRSGEKSFNEKCINLLHVTNSELQVIDESFCSMFKVNFIYKR